MVESGCEVKPAILRCWTDKPHIAGECRAFTNNHRFRIPLRL